MNRQRMSLFVGGVTFYAVSGLVFGVLAGGVTVSAITNAPFMAFSLFLWPFMAISAENWLFILVGVTSGIGVVSVIDRTNLPVSTPSFVPSISARKFSELALTIGVAEVLSRAISAAVFVLYFHIFPPIRGGPPTSLVGTFDLYAESIQFIAQRWGFSHLVLLGLELPEIGSVPSGGPNVIHAVGPVGGMGVANGIGFSVVIGYPIAIILSYLLIRKASEHCVE